MTMAHQNERYWVACQLKRNGDNRAVAIEAALKGAA